MRAIIVLSSFGQQAGYVILKVKRIFSGLLKKVFDGQEK